MKLARAAKALGVNPRTITLWIERAELAPYFSTPARLAGAQRELNDDDLLVANTIRVMRAGVANNAANWPAIAERLASGKLERELPAEAATVDSGMTVLAQHERTVILAHERDTALAHAKELEAQLREQAAQHKAELRAKDTQIDELHGRLADDRERLLRELIDAERRAAAADAALKAFVDARKGAT